jgi:uncharacterized protein (TIGR02145 family)
MMHAQNVGIGTNNPTAKLHVNGTVKIIDGTQGAGKILTSDAAGLASWQTPPATPIYYPSVSICCQKWMTKNLDVSTYRNGDAIPKVTSAAVWNVLNTGAYCYYNNDSATYAAVYGKLYNWYAINDPRGLVPEGWHTATDFEWTTLAECLGGETNAAGPMKELGTTHWIAPNTGATNYTNFNALPGGYRDINGAFSSIGGLGTWWSSTADNASEAWYEAILNNATLLQRSSADKRFGLSVRVIKD